MKLPTGVFEVSFDELDVDTVRVIICLVNSTLQVPSLQYGIRSTHENGSFKGCDE